MGDLLKDVNWAMLGVGVSLIALIVVILNFLLGPRPWARSEKINIKFSSIDYRIIPERPRTAVRVYWGAEFKRTGEEELRYISQIILKPDKQTYAALKNYFALPDEGLITINDRFELPRNKIVSSHGHEPFYPTYESLPDITDPEWVKSRHIASELGQKEHDVTLVWEDGKKSHKTIAQADLGKWI